MNNRKLIPVIISFTICLFAILFIYIGTFASNVNQAKSSDESTTMISKDTVDAELLPSSEFSVHFINVGQADAILVKSGSQTMLVDAGTRSMSQTVVNYLTNEKISQIDYVIGTHPHEDHIGGLKSVLDNFTVSEIMMPKVSATTVTFENLVKTIAQKGLKIKVPTPGTSFKLGDADVFIAAPNFTGYSDINDYSIVLKVTYGNNSFLLTGDVEALSEQEILNKGYNIKSDVLKVGHHGSKSSSKKEFLNAINPQFAIITCGLNNDYGHPHKDTVDALTSINAKILRTDTDGNIIFYSDGKNLRYETYFDQDAMDLIEHDQLINESVSVENSTIGTGTGMNAVYVDKDGKGLIKGNINSKGEKIYHMPGQAYYERTNAEQYFKTEQEALDAGFRKAKV